MNALIDAFDFRFACKQFEAHKKIPIETLSLILEAGRKSPSSFGLEPWYFVAISDSETKKALATACFDQPQVSKCSDFIVILYRKAAHFTAQSPYLRQAVARTLAPNHTETDIDLACASIDHYFTQQLPKEYGFERWAELQTYLAAANMMTMAAALKIDSCAIGGFNHEKVLLALEKKAPKLNAEQFNVGLCIAFGYRDQAQTPQIRWQPEEIITFIN